MALSAAMYRLISAGLVFEGANEVLNFPGAPRTDPVSWSFPGSDDDANHSMVLAGSVGAVAASTDGGWSWRPAPNLHVPEALSIPTRQTMMSLTGGGVPNDWRGASRRARSPPLRALWWPRTSLLEHSRLRSTRRLANK